MDTDELRDAFLQTEQLTTRVRAFRTQRMEEIIAGNTPVRLPPGAKLILHLIPFQAMRPGLQVDIKGLHLRTIELPPLGPATEWGWAYNLDGFLTRPSPGTDGTTSEFTLVFGTGTIELVDTAYLQPVDDKHLIPTIGLEKALINAITRLWQFQQSLGIQPPLVIMLTLTGVKGYALAVGFSVGSGGRKIDRDNLPLPEVLTEEANPDVPRLLRPVFDALWQSAGWNESKNYGENDNWKPRD